MTNSRLLFLTILIGLSSYSGQLLAKGYRAQLIRHYDQQLRVPNLSLPQEIELKYIDEGARLLSIVKLAGRYAPDAQGDWTLFINDKIVYRTKNDKHAFIFDIEIQSPITSFKVHAVGSDGEIIMERVMIEIPRWKEMMIKEKKERKKKRSYLSTSLGYTTLNYKEGSNSSSIDKTFLSTQIDYQLPYWNLATSGRFSFLPLSEGRNDENMKILDLAVRSGYTLPITNFPWKASLLLELFYSTVFNSKGLLGYTDLYGLAVMPALQRLFRNGDIALAYIKVAVDKKAAAIRWYHLLKNKHPLITTLEYENLKTKHNDIDIAAKQFLLNIGYGW